MGTVSIFDQGFLAFATEILVFFFSVEILNVISVKQIPPERFRWEGKIRCRFNRGTWSEKPFIHRCEFTKYNWNCKITQKSSIASGLYYVLLFIEICLNKQCGTRTSFCFSFLSLKLLHQSLHCFRFFFIIPAEVGLGSSKANFRIYLSSFLLNLRLGVSLVNTEKKIHSSHGLKTQIYLAEGEAVLPSDSLWF